MVIVSHDREFLDQLCTKIVETEHGLATTYKGNYSEYVAAKGEAVARQWAAYEKQQKEIARQVGGRWILPEGADGLRGAVLMRHGQWRWRDCLGVQCCLHFQLHFRQLRCLYST